MFKLIATMIINGIFSLLGRKRQQDAESQNEALKGRADSVEDSFKQQEEARKAAEKAEKDAKNQGGSTDVFGADGYQ
jgi:hypothetical protein